MHGDAAAGTVLVEILVPRTGGDDYWRYRSTPATGEVARVDAGRYAEGVWLTPGPPTGQTTCTRGIVRAPSPDGRFVAECSNADREQARLSVKEEETVVYSLSLPLYRGVDGLAWSPSSRAVALLSHSSRHSLWRGPYNTYYLLVVALEPHQSVEYVIRADVLGGEGAAILDWSR
jgi:WD40 repeat protein